MLKETDMNFVTKVILTDRRTAIIVFAVVPVLVGLGNGTAYSQSGARLEIKTLSSRPDMVSGGDALIEVKAPAGAQLSQLTLTLNGKDVTNQLRLERVSGGVRGLISGVVGGEGKLVAEDKAPEAGRARLS